MDNHNAENDLRKERKQASQPEVIDLSISDEEGEKDKRVNEINEDYCEIISTPNKRFKNNEGNRVTPDDVKSSGSKSK